MALLLVLALAVAWATTITNPLAWAIPTYLQTSAASSRKQLFFQTSKLCSAFGSLRATSRAISMLALVPPAR